MDNLYGNKTWVAPDNLSDPFGDWIITSIVVTGAEPWLGTYSFSENSLGSDDITLSKSITPGFGGHLEITFDSEVVPEPSSVLLLFSAITAALAFRWRSKRVG